MKGQIADWLRNTIINLTRPAVAGESIAGARNPNGWRLSLVCCWREKKAAADPRQRRLSMFMQEGSM